MTKEQLKRGNEIERLIDCVDRALSAISNDANVYINVGHYEGMAFDVTELLTEEQYSSISFVIKDSLEKRLLELKDELHNL